MAALRSWFGLPVSTEVGTLVDVSLHFRRLLVAPEGSFLIIEVSGRPADFLQFTASGEGIQIDYPVITPQQISREGSLRAIYTEAELMPYESRGTDGSRFLDCDVPRDAASAAAIVYRIFEQLFGVDSATELRFVESGLAPKR